MVSFFRLLFFVPLGVLGLGFALANRHPIVVAFDPFASADVNGAAITAPLYLVVFIAIIFGVVLGGVASWLAQGKHRRKSRLARAEAERLRADLARASAQRESDKQVALYRA